MSAAALILAAGASRRMGTPKALLQYQDETFLDRLIGIFAPICTEVVVVLGCCAQEIRGGLARDAHFVVNAEWESGQLSSLQCGLGALSLADGIFYTPVDYPGIRAGTPGRLLEAFPPDALFAIPRMQGRRGHPVLFRWSVRAEFLALHEGESARDVVHRHIASTYYVDVDDPGILRDIDVPADYSALLGASQ